MTSEEPYRQLPTWIQRNEALSSTSPIFSGKIWRLNKATTASVFPVQILPGAKRDWRRYQIITRRQQGQWNAVAASMSKKTRAHQRSPECGRRLHAACPTRPPAGDPHHHLISRVLGGGRESMPTCNFWHAYGLVLWMSSIIFFISMSSIS